MTEAEILEQLASHGDRMWSIFQYWTSVSFALLIAGHFAADRIHWLVLVFFGILYASFTYTFVNMAQFDASVIRTGLDQLSAIAEEGQHLSMLGETFISESPLSKENPYALSGFASSIAFIGLFLAALIYPAYCHIKGKKSLN